MIDLYRQLMEKVMVKLPFKRLLDIMLSAYPCCNFDSDKQFQSNHLVEARASKCPQAQWAPQQGHVPRGFLGATGSAEDVKVVFVLAEPGRPHDDEQYQSDAEPLDTLTQSLRHTYKSMKNGTDQFHRNVHSLLQQMFPNLDFDEQLRHVWITESRLCSIDDEIGNISMKARLACAELHLLKQLQAIPNAITIGFGSKATNCLGKLPVDFLKAGALSPPGANFKSTKESWEKAVEAARLNLQ